MKRQINTHNKGSQGEDHACDYLREKGWRIVERNFRARTGEIDIIGRDGETLCFVEVRTRDSELFGHPSETITPHKMKSVRRTAEAYMARHNLLQVAVRFDAITILWNTMEVNHYVNAF